MVTFEAATERATPARKAVSPARAPEERSSPASGIFTEPDVILTMRPNFLLDHRIDHLLRKLDGDHHIGDHAIDHLRARELTEIAERRTSIVVHQDVGLRTGIQEGGLALGGGDIGRNRCHPRAGRPRAARPPLFPALWYPAR